MSDKGSLRIRFSPTEREIILDNKLSDETEAEFLRRILNIIDLHPELLEEEFFTNPDTISTETDTETSTKNNNSDETSNITLDRIDSNLSVLLDGLKVMIYAASKDNEEIKKILNALDKFEDNQGKLG